MALTTTPPTVPLRELMARKARFIWYSFPGPGSPYRAFEVQQWWSVHPTAWGDEAHFRGRELMPITQQYPSPPLAFAEDWEDHRVLERIPWHEGVPPGFLDPTSDDPRWR